MASNSNKKPKLDDSKVPNDFFDSAKEDIRKKELEREIDLFKKQLEVLSAANEESMNKEMEKIQESRNLYELDDQMNRLQKVVEIEKKAEKCIQELNTKRNDRANVVVITSIDGENTDDEDSDDLFNDWRSRNAMSKISR